MEKISQSMNVNTNTTTTNNSGSSSTSSLRQLNKASYKISKQTNTNTATAAAAAAAAVAEPPLAVPDPSPNANPSSSSSPAPPPPLPSQPPVYNINKNDFRDVVQRLTGLPAHSPVSSSSSSQQYQTNQMKPAVSRLHRIRPPPLASLPPPGPPLASASQFSPLPPLPAVSAAAESPITAYMRRLRAGEPSPLATPCAQPIMSPTAALSPTLLFPTSPGPVPSPRWSDP